MAEITKINLGHATAYGYYKAGGGTATEEEFIQLCADLGIQVEYLENMTVIVNALEPGEPATATYENGVLTFGIPKGEKGDPAPQEEITTATDAWLAENITNPSNPPLDRSLTLANAAAPADLTGELKSAIDNVIIESETVDFSTAGYIPGAVGETNVWNVYGSLQSYTFDVSGLDRIEITANSTGSVVVCLLASSTLVGGETPTYATGCSRELISAGESKAFAVPDDCVFVVISKQYASGEDRTPASTEFSYYKTIPEIDNTLSVSGDAADAKATGDAIDKIWDGDTGVFQYSQAQLISTFGKYSTGLLYSASNSLVTTGATFPDDVATTASTGAYAILLDVSDVKSISYPKYKNTSGRGCLMLDSDYVVKRTFPNLSDANGTMATIDIASTEKYFVFGVSSTLSGLEWTFTIAKDPTKGINDLTEDVTDLIEGITDLAEDVAENSQNIAYLQDKIIPTPKLDAEIVGFICYGQSWSMGYDTNAIVSTQRYDNIMLDSGLMNDPATDLVVSATAFSPLVEQTVWSSDAHSQKCGETPCTGQTDIIKQLLLSENGLSDTDISYQIFSAAPGMGNRSLEILSYPEMAQTVTADDNDGRYYNRLLDVVETANTIARSQGKVLVIPAVSWAQGQATNNDEIYYDKLELLRSHLDTDIKAITGQTIPVKMIVWQAVVGNTTPNRSYSRYVYASEKYENIICSGTFYYFDHKADDNLHLTATSQDWLGCQFGIAYKRSIVDGEKFIPLKPKSVEVYGNIAYLDFYVPVKPLVFDTTLVADITGKGFQIFDSTNTEKTISAVEIVAPDRVKIVCASNFATTDHIVYGGNGTSAYNPETGKRGNLRDSQNIVYTNHANTELHCYNWCVVFDKTIAELTPSA